MLLWTTSGCSLSQAWAPYLHWGLAKSLITDTSVFKSVADHRIVRRGVQVQADYCSYIVPGRVGGSISTSVLVVQKYSGGVILCRGCEAVNYPRRVKLAFQALYSNQYSCVTSSVHLPVLGISLHQWIHMCALDVQYIIFSWATNFPYLPQFQW